MVVEVYKLVKGEPEQAAEASALNGSVVINGDDETIDFLLRFSCRTRDGRVVTHEDGEAWLEALPDNLRGSHLWAEARPNGDGPAALHEASIFAVDVPFNEKLHPRDRRGRFAKKAGLSGLIGGLDFDHPPSVTEGPKSKIFLDPYHRSIETAASPRFKPLPKPTSDEAAREKVPGQPETVLAPTVEERIRGMQEGDEIRFAEGTLVTAGPGGDTHRVEVGGTPVRPEDVAGSPELREKFADYDRRWAEASRRLGLDVNHTEQEGFWDGEEEPSIATTAEAEQRQIEAAAALVGKHFNQDAMAVFTYDDDGPGARFSVKIPEGTDRSKLAEQIKEGMPEGQGASVQGDEAYFYAGDWAEGDEWAHGLADALGSDEVTGQRGTFTLLSEESYGDRTYTEAIEAAPEANALDQEWADEEGRGPDARPEGGGGSEAPAQALGPLDQTFRIDGPDGTFWRVDRRDVDEVVEFEETTARANRYGAQIPGNPMVPLKGVDVKSEDPVGDAVGGTYHGGYSILPRGTIIHRKPGDAGDTFEVTSPLGTRVEIPATDKPAIIAAAKDMERKAEGKLGGDAKTPENFKPTTKAADPDGPLQPLPEGFRDTRVAMHAQSERVLGYEHGGNEVALIRTEGGFGTPWYEDDDGKQTRWRVDGTDIVVEKQDENGEPHETVRAPIGPIVTAENAQALADFFTLADRMQREARENGKRPDGEVTDRRFDAPIIWPEHLDMAIELSAPVPSDPNSRVTVGASPGDEGHPEPYFYVAPWDFKGGRSETWNAVGFNGAQLDYADVLASDDQERTIREFYERYMKLVDAWQTKSDSTLSKPQAIHEASIYAVEFDEKLHPRDRKGRFRKLGGLPPYNPLVRWHPRPAGPGHDSWWRNAPGTREEYAAANRYIARDWNHALRVHSDDQLPRFIKDETDKVASLINKQPNQPKGKHFWRGLSTSGLLDPNTLKVGDEIKDDGFLSVTEDLSLAAAFEEHSLAHGGSEGVMLRINLTKPEPAMNAEVIMRKEEDEGFFDGQFSSYDEFEDYLWSEMVFHRHSKMVVTGVGEMDVPVAEWPDPPTAETRKVKVLDVDLS